MRILEANDDLIEWASGLGTEDKAVALDLLEYLVGLEAFARQILGMIAIPGGPIDYWAKQTIPELRAKIKGE